MEAKALSTSEVQNMVEFLAAIEFFAREYHIKSPIFPEIEPAKWRMRIRRCNDENQTLGIVVFHGSREDAPKSVRGDFTFHGVRQQEANGTGHSLVSQAIGFFHTWGASEIANRILSGSINFNELVEEE